MTDQATATAAEGDEASAGLIHIHRKNATVQCVFLTSLEKLPCYDCGLTVVAELPHGKGKQTVLEGPASAYLDLANWAAVEGILTKDPSLLYAYRRIHERLGEEGVKVEVEPPREVTEVEGEPSMVLWGPEVLRLIRGREPFKSTLLGSKKRISLAVVLKEIERGAVLFYYGRRYYLLKTPEFGHIELSFVGPQPKRAIVIAVDLDEKEAERVTRWAESLKLSKPEVIRVLVRGLPKSTEGGRTAIASGVFTELPVRERKRIERLVGKLEKQLGEAAMARAAAAADESRRVKKYLRAIEELGRGRIDEAVAGLEAAVKAEQRGRRRKRQ